MYSGSNDASCPASQAGKHAAMIPGMANFVVINDADHGFFGSYKGADYVDQLIGELAVVTPIDNGGEVTPPGPIDIGPDVTPPGSDDASMALMASSQIAILAVLF